MIGLSYWLSTREGRAPAWPEGFWWTRGRDALVASAPRRRPSPHRTRQARPSRFVFSPCPRALRVDRPEARGCPAASRAEAARVHRVASGRSTRSARRLGDTEIGFVVGLRAASPTGEGREMIGLSYWPNGRGRRSTPCTLAKTDCGVARYSGRRSHIGLCQTCACAASAFRRRTRQARPSRFVHLLALASTMKSGGLYRDVCKPILELLRAFVPPRAPC